jgi:hypothetical protein
MVYQPGLYGDGTIGGLYTLPVTATQVQAGLVVKAAPGRLCSVLVTTTTTANQAVLIYDTTTTTSTAGSTIIGMVPVVATTGVVAGTIFSPNMPAANGIVIGANANFSTGALTVSFI